MDLLPIGRFARLTGGAPREIYETSPEEVPDPADWLTEIQFPFVRDEARIEALAG